MKISKEKNLGYFSCDKFTESLENKKITTLYIYLSTCKKIAPNFFQKKTSYNACLSISFRTLGRTQFLHQNTSNFALLKLRKFKKKHEFGYSQNSRFF